MDDLVRRLDMADMTTHPMTLVMVIREAANCIEAQNKRNKELQVALGLADAALGGANMNMDVVQKKVRAALGEKQDG
jgi:hypothetical protein